MWGGPTGTQPPLAVTGSDGMVLDSPRYCLSERIQSFLSMEIQSNRETLLYRVRQIQRKQMILYTFHSRLISTHAPFTYFFVAFLHSHITKFPTTHNQGRTLAK